MAQSCISPDTLNKVVDVINTNAKNADDRNEKLLEELQHMNSKLQRTEELCSYLSSSLNEINDLFQTSVQNMICDKILARIENISQDNKIFKTEINRSVSNLSQIVKTEEIL